MCVFSETNFQSSHLCNVYFGELKTKRSLLSPGHLFCESCLVGDHLGSGFGHSCRTFSYKKNYKCNQCKKKIKRSDSIFFTVHSLYVFKVKNIIYAAIVLVFVINYLFF